uniref:Uncharacterized protein n=1 Tax=Arundo donax TaxID=35708 RepID=A0A0A9GLH7_ARUDO
MYVSENKGAQYGSNIMSCSQKFVTSRNKFTHRSVARIRFIFLFWGILM